ncbi:adhesin [Pantoea sp. FDAARGOS_194]|nr:adhesin [Pantoea sp. FDAARGOS_194]
MKGVTPGQLKAAEAEWRKANPGKEPTASDISGQAYQTFYNQAFKESGFGTGGKLQQAIQAATAAVQGLAGGNLAQAASGAAVPYLAEVIHDMTITKGPDGKEVVNVEANLMAHAVVGAVTAYAAGNSALAGASGAAMGEYIAQQMYPGVDRKDLTEQQRQTISALGTVAAGLAGGVTGDSTAGAVAGAQAGRNAVENNWLHEDESRQLDKEMQDCKKSGGDCNKVVEKYINISNKNSKELKEACTGGGVACVTWEELIQADTNVARDASHSQFRLSEKLKDPSAAALVNYLNGTDLKFLKENITTGDRVMSVVIDPTSWPVLVMGGKAIMTNAVNNTKEQLIAVGMGAGLGAGIQYGTTGEVKLSDVIGSGVIGAITASKGYNPTMVWNAAGGYYQAEISGDDPFMAALLSKTGASVGYAAGNVIKVPFDKKLNPISKQYEWVSTGVWTITKPAPQNPLPSIVGNFGDSVASGMVQDKLKDVGGKQ